MDNKQFKKLLSQIPTYDCNLWDLLTSDYRSSSSKNLHVSPSEPTGLVTAASDYYCMKTSVNSTVAQSWLVIKDKE